MLINQPDAGVERIHGVAANSEELVHYPTIHPLLSPARVAMACRLELVVSETDHVHPRLHANFHALVERFGGSEVYVSASSHVAFDHLGAVVVDLCALVTASAAVPLTPIALVVFQFSAALAVRTAPLAVSVSSVASPLVPALLPSVFDVLANVATPACPSRRTVAVGLALDTLAKVIYTGLAPSMSIVESHFCSQVTFFAALKSPTQPARTLVVRVVVTKFAVGAIRFAVRPAAPVVLANDNVAEAALAPRSFVTPGLVPRALRLVHAQTRITLL